MAELLSALGGEEGEDESDHVLQWLSQAEGSPRERVPLAWRWLRFLEVVGVCFGDGDGSLRRDSDGVVDHESGKLLPVDQDKAVRHLLSIADGGIGEGGCGDEDALCRSAACERSIEGLDLWATNGVLPALGLHIDFLQAEFVEGDDAIDPPIARSADRDQVFQPAL